MTARKRRGAIIVRVAGRELTYRCDDEVEVGDTVAIETGVFAGRRAEVVSLDSFHPGALHDCRAVDPVEELADEFRAAQRRRRAAERELDEATAESVRLAGELLVARLRDRV